MKAIIAAIHGIMTNQTDPSWPDKFDAWMYERDPEVKVLKKEYRAGPFPHWNCWLKDPLLASSLANEIELLLGLPLRSGERAGVRCSANSTLQRFNASPPVWFVAHSNGAVIALLTAKALIERGHYVGGLILTGAACEADIHKNQIVELYSRLFLGAAIAYSSEDDRVVDGDARAPAPFFAHVRAWLWGKLMSPYGCLGRTGWLANGKPLEALVTPTPPPTPPNLSLTPRFSEVLTTEADAHNRFNGFPSQAAPSSTIHQLSSPLCGIFTRWYPGGHSTYFNAQNIDRTFEQIYQDIRNACDAHFGSPSAMRFHNVPKGRHENSPAFQRRDHDPNNPSPEGTAEIHPTKTTPPPACHTPPIQPSLRDSSACSPNPGVETPGYCHDVPPGQNQHNFVSFATFCKNPFFCQ